MDPAELSDSCGKGDPACRAASLTETASVLSCDSPSLLFFFLLAFFDMGSNEMTRAFGGGMGPISTDSTKEILQSQLEVAAIDVGLVIVAVIM
jgi:hypothetical protein